MTDEHLLQDFIRTHLNVHPRLHSVKVRNGWNEDGTPTREIVVRIRRGFEDKFALPETFEGVPVVREKWSA